MVNLKNERAPKKLSFNNSKTVKVAKHLSVDFDLFAYTIWDITTISKNFCS
jgi:hypothetical protein